MICYIDTIKLQIPVQPKKEGTVNRAWQGLRRWRTFSKDCQTSICLLMPPRLWLSDLVLFLRKSRKPGSGTSPPRQAVDTPCHYNPSQVLVIITSPDHQLLILIIINSWSSPSLWIELVSVLFTCFVYTFKEEKSSKQEQKKKQESDNLLTNTFLMLHFVATLAWMAGSSLPHWSDVSKYSPY